MQNNNDIGIRITAEVDKRSVRALRSTAKESEMARKRMIGQTGKDARAIGNVTRSQNNLSLAASDTSRSIGREDTAFKRASRSIGDYSRKLAKATKNHFDLKKAAAATGSAINTKLTAIGGGAAVGLSARELVNDEAFWTRLKTDSSAAEETIEDLKKRTFDMSVQMRIDPDQLKAAIAEIQQQTGDLDLARENLENMAIAIQGSGSAGVDIGGLIANMNKKLGLRSADEMLANLDIAKQLGDKGAFTLKDYSNRGGRVISNLGARGITGTQGNIEAMALLQFGQQGTDSKDMAVSASEAVTRDIVNNRDALTEMGIDVFDPDKEGEQMRLPSEIIKEIFTATEGRTTGLTEIFGDESIRLVNAMAADYKQGWKDYNNYLGTQGDGVKLSAAAEENKSTASSGLTYLSALWKSFLDDAGSSLITSTADLFDDTDNDTAKKVVGSTGLGAMGAAGGASVGAAIGSIVPVLGTAVGAGVGAIVGGLGGAISGYFLSGDSEDDNRTITDSSTRFAATENQQTNQNSRSISQTINTSTSADQQAQTLIQQFQRQEALIKEKATASSAPISISMGEINFVQKEGERDEDFLERARQMIREEMELAAETLRREQERALTDNTGASYG
ncbi:hypothetical protein NX722_13595 [Endozoicomonas gorgoniicola]|uniref:Phage tail tape measure protein domain-containing protein n=1 Tax=Endozoicomonas gorgoniicola TaxID=1234144 RepID=A0ABT3MW96_9GAMM|nr:hypothetical protein [Endozoicomonas gorgoniicola]MCW7553642.1 hypothetical protein [Endozoicomonas gorgoniicola]